MRINGVRAKFAFRKIAENTIRAVIVQTKQQGEGSMLVTLESPVLHSWTKTQHTFGYEFVHLTDTVDVSYVDESFSYAGLPLNIKLPSVNNISILSSGNITKGTSDKCLQLCC